MELVTLPITLVTAGGAAIINLWLAVRVSHTRHASGVSIGDGGDTRLIARMRAQANFVEYAPFIVILIGLIELTQGPSTILWLSSVAFLLARVAHPFGMDGVRYCRSAGTTVTMALLLGLAVYAISLPLRTGSASSTPSIEAAPPRG